MGLTTLWHGWGSGNVSGGQRESVEEVHFCYGMVGTAGANVSWRTLHAWCVTNKQMHNVQIKTLHSHNKMCFLCKLTGYFEEEETWTLLSSSYFPKKSKGGSWVAPLLQSGDRQGQFHFLGSRCVFRCWWGQLARFNMCLSAERHG